MREREEMYKNIKEIINERIHQNIMIRGKNFLMLKTH